MTYAPNESGIKVFFLQVTSPQEKIQKILKIILNYHLEKKALFLKTENEKSNSYLDRLLWEYPKDGFIPHQVEKNLVTSSIFISCNPSFPLDVYSFFNLTKEPLVPPDSARKIYEIEENFPEEKKKIFEKKYKYYSELGYHLISL